MFMCITEKGTNQIILYLFCNNGLDIANLHGKFFVDFVDFVKARVATACLEDVPCM